MITEKLGRTGEMPPMIIVGVANTHRYRDLLPVPTRGRAETGGAEAFLKVLENEIIPYVEKNYRTKPFRVLAGPQAAAIFSLYALLENPQLFNIIIAENPFMNPDNAEYLYPRADTFFKTSDRFNNYLYIKCENDERPDMLGYAKKLADLLENEKPAGLRFKIDFMESSGFFITPLPFKAPLREFFTGHRLPDDFQASNLDDILQYYEERSEAYGFDVDPPEHMLTFQGVGMNQQNKTGEAIKVFQYQHKLYPKSLNALFQLGESYRGLGQYELAAKYYKAFLDIEDRDAAFIKQRLEEVTKKIGD